MKSIYFVTSNQRKVEDYNRRFEQNGYHIDQLNMHMDEGRSLYIAEIAKIKLEQAKKASENKPVFVEDRGFFIPALNGFPGPFVKLFLNSIGIEGLIKLMEEKKDRTAKFISVLAYWDGIKEHYFYDNEEGFLLEEVKAGNLRGWTEILYIYGYKTLPGKALCEMNDQEWNEYLKEIEKNDYVKQFLNYLKSV